jgi:hypothetical protein
MSIGREHIQMYGRASFQLLRRRILPYQQDPCFVNTYRAP